jgi:hypothetical protein
MGDFPQDFRTAKGRGVDEERRTRESRDRYIYHFPNTQTTNQCSGIYTKNTIKDLAQRFSSLVFPRHHIVLWVVVFWRIPNLVGVNERSNGVRIEGDIYITFETHRPHTHTHISLSVSTREAAHGIDPALFGAPNLLDMASAKTPF